MTFHISALYFTAHFPETIQTSTFILLFKNLETEAYKCA